MTKRALAILVAAIILVGAAAAVVASSIGGSNDAGATHMMPDGQTMQGGGMSTGQSMPGHDMKMDE